MKKLILLALLAASPAVADTEQHRMGRCVTILDQLKFFDDTSSGIGGNFATLRETARNRLVDFIEIFEGRPRGPLDPNNPIDKLSIEMGIELKSPEEEADEYIAYANSNCLSKELLPELPSCLGWLEFSDDPSKAQVRPYPLKHAPHYLLNLPSITENLPFPYQNQKLIEEAFLQKNRVHSIFIMGKKRAEKDGSGKVVLKPKEEIIPCIPED